MNGGLRRGQVRGRHPGPSPQGGRKISVEIERVVLHGLPAASGPAVVEAMEAELGRLVAELGLPARLRSSSAEIERLDAVEELRPGAGLGAELACAVYRSLLASPSTGEGPGGGR